MTLRILACLGGLLWLGASCGPSHEEASAAAQQARQRLAKAVRDTATVAGLHGLVAQEYRRAEYAQARADLQLLRRRYPHAPVLATLAPLTGRLDSLALAQQQRADARQRRQAQGLQPAPLAWRLQAYADEFGKPTGRVALTNATGQQGTIVAEGAASSPLVARILVDSSAAIRLLLYDQVPLVPPPVQRKHHFRRRHRHAPADTAVVYTTSYAAMHQYRVAQPTPFVVKVRRHDGYIATLPATMLADRLVLDKANSRALHECLLPGGEVGFLLSQLGRPGISYRFTIANADLYEAGYHSLLRR